MVAVCTAPVEQIEREGIELVPGNLLRQEKIDAGFSQNLRHRGGVAEHIGQPQIPDILPELVHEEILPVQYLPHHRLTTDNVAVGLDPHTALQLPTPRLDRFLNLFGTTPDSGLLQIG